jgi:glutaminyl-tRNA synthetase
MHIVYSYTHTHVYVRRSRTRCTVWAAYHPKNASYGGREVRFSGVIYIEAEDFASRPTDATFKGLTLTQPVGLLATQIMLTCTQVHVDGDGKPQSLTARASARSEASKPKGNLHWVSDGGCVQAEMRLIGSLLREVSQRFKD